MQLEQELLVLFARATLEPNQWERASELLAGGLDWDLLRYLAEYHEVFPLLFLNLKQAESGGFELPDREAWVSRFQQIALYNLRLSGELRRLLSLLERHRIPVLAIKGPVLTQRIYGNLTHRIFSDLDLLVSLDDLPRVNELLLNAGYRWAFPEGIAEDGVPGPLDFERQYLHSETGAMLDLHWRTCRPDMTFSSSLEDLWERRETVMVSDCPVPTLSLDDQLLQFCIHGTRHAWSQLKWICDLNALIRSHPEIMRPRLEEKARKGGCRRSLTFGIKVVEAFYGPIGDNPSRKAVALRSDPVTAMLTYLVKRNLFQEDKLLRDYRLRWAIHGLALERWRDWRRFYVPYLNPTLADKRLVPLHRRLEFLYYPIRFIRMGKEYGWKAFLYSIRLLKSAITGK